MLIDVFPNLQDLLGDRGVKSVGAPDETPADVAAMLEERYANEPAISEEELERMSHAFDSAKEIQ